MKERTGKTLPDYVWYRNPSNLLLVKRMHSTNDRDAKSVRFPDGDWIQAKPRSHPPTEVELQANTFDTSHHYFYTLPQDRTTGNLIGNVPVAHGPKTTIPLYMVFDHRMVQILAHNIWSLKGHNAKDRRFPEP